MRNARQKRDLGELDPEEDIFDGNIREEEDVYDIMDEEEYRSLVESRRQREDFVVDDGGCAKFIYFVCFVCLFRLFVCLFVCLFMLGLVD
jgi:hypothetical protein